MTDKKYLGIWMDHSVAHFVEYTKHSTPIENEDITLTQEDKNTVASDSVISSFSMGVECFVYSTK